MSNSTKRRIGRCETAIALIIAAGLAGVFASDAIAADTASQVATDAPQDAATDIEEVTVLAKAMRVSPSNVPLDALEPTSSIPEGFIRNNIVPLANFDDIVKFAPSVFAQSPNGPGLGKNETLSMRGFQDGQFNVTFDGIPFGDSTDLHHTTSSLFISHDLANAEIDRGPGGGATLGKATFGGTMGLMSKAPSDSTTFSSYGTLGSFDTRSIGAEVDSGETPLGKMFFDAQRELSNGYLTNASENRTNFFFKDVLDVGDNLTLTGLLSYNHAFEYTTQGATIAEINQYGRNYGLGTDPKNQAYYGYQPSNCYSDFEYLRAKYKLGDDWVIDDTVYSDTFGHVYTESKDASDNNPADDGVTVYDSTGKKIATLASDIPGKKTVAWWRAYGDILRISDTLPFGTFKTGVWYEQQPDSRYSIGTDLTTGNSPVNSKYGTPYTYNIKNVPETWQPYAEFDWNITPDFMITPGVKYTAFSRDINALLNKTKPPAPLTTSENYNAVQPSIMAQYKFDPQWTAYAQVAKGFLAPPVDVLEVQSINPIKPEQTWNYQVGTTLERELFTLSAAVYYINFSNYLATSMVSTPTGQLSTYVNSAGAIYKGAEIEGQYAVGYGFSVYGNASFNSAEYKNSSVWVAESPRDTAALGVLYDDRSGPYGSLIGKVIGPHYGLDNTTDANGNVVFGNQYHINSQFTADLAIGWNFRNVEGWMKGLGISLKVGNLFNNRDIDDFAGNQSVSGAPLYWTEAGRSIFFNLMTAF